MHLFRFPALAPQRGARLRGRTGLLLIVPDWTLDTQRLASLGVFFNWCRGGAITEAREGLRATGSAHGERSAVSTQRSARLAD
jgi:hypothetical protein